MIHWQKNIYIYKYLFWAKYPPFYAPDQEKKNLKFFYAPYGLKEYRCKVSTIYLYYYTLLQTPGRLVLNSDSVFLKTFKPSETNCNKQKTMLK